MTSVWRVQRKLLLELLMELQKQCLLGMLVLSVKFNT